jgi:hypothetical protein
MEDDRSIEEVEAELDAITDRANDRHATVGERYLAGEELMNKVKTLSEAAIKVIDANGGPHTLPSMELLDSWKMTGLRCVYDQMRHHYKLTD